MNKTNLLIVVLIIIILVASIFLGLYYFNNMKDECVSNPLVFGAKQLTEQYGYNFSGYGFFDVPIGYQNLKVTFNSTNMVIEN